ncbi:MAG: VCBS repeat-containing protein [Candidatus Hydrogenedentes bacterium]|nr:VCBS repeat-containing protein [Candidatus Hydrogenedentota bacterium]
MSRMFLPAVILCAATLSATAQTDTPKAWIHPDWTLERIAAVDQRYAGWDVEIGDADNDGQNEVLVTGCPDSRLYLFKKTAGADWETRLLAENLAEQTPGMGLTVKVADLNGDGRNAVLVGTGQEKGGTAFFHLLETDGSRVTRKLSLRPECNQSSFTHNFALHDLDGDGVLEVVSAYCGGGEIIRYDFNPGLTEISARKIHRLSGSGEESLIADVDNDGKVEHITSNSFRAGQARVEIFEFDDAGELVTPPRVVLEGFEGLPCFYASIITGDLTNDGKTEMVVGWKREQAENRATLAVYRVGENAELLAVLDRDTEDLDMAYFEKMMAVADADNDGKNELYVSTRGDNHSERINSQHLGRLYRYTLDADGANTKTLLLDFDPEWAESSWLAVGDADNDGKSEIILATGKGDRTLPGTSHVVILRRK